MVNLSTNHWNLHNFSPCLTPRVNNNTLATIWTLGSCRQQSGNLLTTTLDNSENYEFPIPKFPLSFTKWIKWLKEHPQQTHSFPRPKASMMDMMGCSVRV